MQSQHPMIPCDKKQFREFDRAPKDSSKKNSPVTKQTMVFPGKAFYSNSNSPLVQKSLLMNTKLGGVPPPLLSFGGVMASNQTLQNYLLLQNQFANVQSSMNPGSPGPSKSKQRNSKTNPKSIGIMKSIAEVTTVPKQNNMWRFPQPFQVCSLKGSPVQHSKTKDRDSSLKKMVQTSGLSANLLSPSTPTGQTRKSNSQGKKKSTQQLIWSNLSRRNKRSLNSQFDPSEEQLALHDCTNSFAQPVSAYNQAKGTPSRHEPWRPDTASNKGTPLGHKATLLSKQPYSLENVPPNLLHTVHSSEAATFAGAVGRLLLMNSKSQPRVQKQKSDSQYQSASWNHLNSEANESLATQPRTPLYIAEHKPLAKRLSKEDVTPIVERLTGVRIHHRPQLPTESADLLLKVAQLVANMKQGYEQQQEIYELVKEYVDLAQESTFKQLDQLLAGVKTTKVPNLLNFAQSSAGEKRGQQLTPTNHESGVSEPSMLTSKLGEERLLAYGLLSTSLGLAIKLERWAVMIFFYLTFRNLDQEQNIRNLLESILEVLHVNSALVNLILITDADKREAVYATIPAYNQQELRLLLEESPDWLQKVWNELEKSTHILQAKMLEW